MTKAIQKEWPERQEKTWKVVASQKQKEERDSKEKQHRQQQDAEESSPEVRIGKYLFKLLLQWSGVD